ncbi:MAG TPA: DUF6186 family protein [Acidimicrobiales bacterium]|nr:DUF6186 family protein [Acidimicrobiales bacterium]
MTRLVTLLGYAVIAVAALALEAAARRSGRLATFGEALSIVRRSWPLRLVLLAGWLWLGWHLFVRVDWR